MSPSPLILSWLFLFLTLSLSMINSEIYYKSAHPYYDAINCCLVDGDWFVTNKSYPWITLLPFEDATTHSYQEAIYSHQHHSDCASESYFIAPSHNAGLGSSLHVLSEYFAVSNTSVMMYDNLWVNWTEGVAMCDANHQNPDCYFEPISNCIDYVYEHHLSSYLQAITTKTPVDRFQIATGKFNQYKYSLPFGIQDVSVWRMQWAKYVFKPNQRMIDYCREFVDSHLVRLGPKDKVPVPVSVDLHPPLNCIGMHIRHGDKGQEMGLIGYKDYLEAAERLVRHHGLSRNIILATDDEKIIRSIVPYPRNRQNFTIYFLSYGRQNDAGGSAVRFASKHNLRLEIMVNTLSDLIIGSHPNIGGFVQTTKSNFDRIINELRKSDGKRAMYPHIDLIPGEF